jgi:hypothetical protein
MKTASEILDKNLPTGILYRHRTDRNNIIKAMLEYAELACFEQKRLCHLEACILIQDGDAESPETVGRYSIVNGESFNGTTEWGEVNSTEILETELPNLI